jgi:carboxylesterase type B
MRRVPSRPVRADRPRRLLGPGGAHLARPDQLVSDTLLAYWTRFALTLDPNQAGAPPWPRARPGDPVRLVLDAAMAPSRDAGASCSFWDAVGYAEQGLFERMRAH